MHCPKSSGDRIYLDPYIYIFLDAKKTKHTVDSAAACLKASLENVDATEAKLVCFINTFCVSVITTVLLS